MARFNSHVNFDNIVVSDSSFNNSVVNGDFQNIDLETALNGSNSKINSTPLADRVRNSDNYKIAYNLFYPYKDSSPEWLAQLESVPTMVDDADPTWFDKYGLTNKYDDKQDASYQFCMEYIAELIRNFQDWRNSLPITQAGQFAQAGYNSAITGQGLEGSDIGDISRPSVNPSSLSSTNPIDVVDSIGSVFTNFGSGVLGYISSLNAINIAKRKLDLEGLKYALDKDKVSGDQLLSWLGISKQFSDSGYGDINLPTPKSVGSSADHYKVELVGTDKNFAESLKSETNLLDASFQNSIHPSKHVHVSEYTNTLHHYSKYRFETWKKQQEYERAKVDYETSLYEGLDPKLASEHQNKMFKYERELFDMKFKYINELYDMQLDPNNHTAQYLFNYVMSGGYDLGLQNTRVDSNNISRAGMIGNTVVGGLGALAIGARSFIPSKKR